MADVTASAVEERSYPPPWLWAKILSLDAPLVAVSWCILAGRSLHVGIPPAAVLALGLCVWMIYVLDRKLDVLTPIAAESLAPRHQFYAGRNIFPALAFTALAAVCVLVPELDRALVRRGVLLAACVAGYLALVHLAPEVWQRFWPKELAVALAFACGTFLPVIHRIQAGPFVFFTLLCWLNCSAIEYWESGTGHLSTVWLGKHITLIASGVCVASAILLLFRPEAALFYAAVLLAGALLAVLGLTAHSLDARALRVLADAALLTPLAVLVLS